MTHRPRPRPQHTLPHPRRVWRRSPGRPPQSRGRRGPAGLPREAASGVGRV